MIDSRLLRTSAGTFGKWSELVAALEPLRQLDDQGIEAVAEDYKIDAMTVRGLINISRWAEPLIAEIGADRPTEEAIDAIRQVRVPGLKDANPEAAATTWFLLVLLGAPRDDRSA